MRSLKKFRREVHFEPAVDPERIELPHAGFHPAALPILSYRSKQEATRTPGGEGGDRTRELLLATQALSQRELHPQSSATMRIRGSRMLRHVEKVAAPSSDLRLLFGEPGRDRTFDRED